MHDQCFILCDQVYGTQLPCAGSIRSKKDGIEYKNDVLGME